MWPFSRPTQPAAAPASDKPESVGFFSTDFIRKTSDIGAVLARTFQNTKPIVPVNETGAAMDSASDVYGVKAALQSGYGALPEAQVNWYASQGFIGYQFCAMLAQHWLIDKACSMPADDAIRNGWQITINDGTEADPSLIDSIREYDKAVRLDQHLREFLQMSRVFGVRVALFRVESTDPDYYTKPFNPDGVKPGSYKGIVQIDPYWMTPELDMQSASDPASQHFYEPTWWRVNGVRYHRTHLIVYVPSPVADILKPSYLYGGLSIPQRIYERVYAAERTANEAPMLAMTKRLNVIHADMSKVAGNQAAFEERLATWVQYRDNYGVKVLGKDETAEQFDTALADLDEVIMTQHQLVAAAAGIPATKLLGTQPKGFNSTGEHESRSYHEFLESLQCHGAGPMLERHYLLLSRAYFGGQNIVPVWNPTDSPTAKEIAEINKLKADTAAQLSAVGAIDGQDERARITADPDSGYSGLPDAEPEDFTEGLENEQAI